LERPGWEGENPQRVLVPNDEDDGSKMSFNIRLLLLKITSHNWSPCPAVHCCNCDRKLAVTAQKPNTAGAVSPLLFLVLLPFLLFVTTFSAV